MNKFTYFVFTGNLLEAASRAYVNATEQFFERYAIDDNVGISKVGLVLADARSFYHQNNFMSIDLVLKKRNLPKRAIQQTLEKRVSAEQRAFNEKASTPMSDDEVLACRDRIMEEIIQAALIVSKPVKVYVFKNFMCVESSGSELDQIFLWVKGMLAELCDFAETDFKIATIEKSKFNEIAQIIIADNDAAKVVCTVDDDAKITIEGADFVEENKELLRGDVKSLKFVRNEYEYTMNQKLVVSGIKLYDDTESDKDAIEIVTANCILKIVSEVNDFATWSPDDE